MMFLLTSLPHHRYLFSILFLQQAEAADFDDLGTMLLGGFAVAIAVAVLFVFVKLRLRARKPEQAEFLSINSISERK
jgi:high-affinity Fe2+/Pb2+ permease